MKKIFHNHFFLRLIEILKTIIIVDNIVLYDENVSNPNIKRRNTENLDMHF